MNSKWSQQNQKELTDEKIRKLHLSRIFRYGNSQVYHFANNNVMAQNETVITLNCFLTWEEKLSFVTFCMMTFFWGSMGDKISWDSTLSDFSFCLFPLTIQRKMKHLPTHPLPAMLCRYSSEGICRRHQLKERAGCSLH